MFFIISRYVLKSRTLWLNADQVCHISNQSHQKSHHWNHSKISLVESKLSRWLLPAPSRSLWFNYYNCYLSLTTIGNMLSSHVIIKANFSISSTSQIDLEFSFKLKHKSSKAILTHQYPGNLKTFKLNTNSSSAS